MIYNICLSCLQYSFRYVYYSDSADSSKSQEENFQMFKVMMDGFENERLNWKKRQDDLQNLLKQASNVSSIILAYVLYYAFESFYIFSGYCRIWYILQQKMKS